MGEIRGRGCRERGTQAGLGINAFLHQLNPNEYTKINTTPFFFPFDADDR